MSAAKVVNHRARSGVAVVAAHPGLLDLPGLVGVTVGTFDVSFQYTDTESVAVALSVLARHWATEVGADETYVSRRAVHDGVEIRVVWTASPIEGGDPS
jgi:hypothetical protein